MLLTLAPQALLAPPTLQMKGLHLERHDFHPLPEIKAYQFGKLRPKNLKKRLPQRKHCIRLDPQNNQRWIEDLPTRAIGSIGSLQCGQGMSFDRSFLGDD